MTALKPLEICLAQAAVVLNDLLIDGCCPRCHRAYSKDACSEMAHGVDALPDGAGRVQEVISNSQLISERKSQNIVHYCIPPNCAGHRQAGLRVPGQPLIQRVRDATKVCTAVVRNVHRATSFPQGVDSILHYRKVAFVQHALLEDELVPWPRPHYQASAVPPMPVRVQVRVDENEAAVIAIQVPSLYCRRILLANDWPPAAHAEEHHAAALQVRDAFRKTQLSRLRRARE
eukprot:CAMPEP_0204565056 /NCGR_PEP_ID=MMETSP0661-20131031/35246_1 /ASSEMBLY_ACC=CAM_ASM_000606 /TAXON_ID=109239 /ORGANISM="Alexandrium margalefi, Strain AMGDE01CS-322" /LENGTH=230 /DNA_ID=CAMNT_0051572763 /DNA_START=175 /DNA_END=868 /DNA_ORIENTATION=-